MMALLASLDECVCSAHAFALVNTTVLGNEGIESTVTNE